MKERAARVRIAVLSSKGGCGRTTAAVNLAFLLAASGRKTALVDLAQFGSLSLLLRIPQAPGYGLGPVAACLASVHRGELPEVLQSAMPPCKLGSARVHVLPAAPPQRQDDLDVAGVVDLMNALTAEGYAVVMDTSHELSDRLAGALHSATHRLWVLSPDPAAGWHMLQALEAARQLAAPPVPSGMLINRQHRRTGLLPDDLSAATGLPVWGVVPDMPGALPLAAHRSVPLLAHRPGPVRRALNRVLEETGAKGAGRPAWPLLAPPWRRPGQEAAGHE